MKKSRIIILFVIYSLWGNLFSPTYCAENTKHDTLALVGQKVITADDFITAYKEKMRKVGLTDNGETRVQYLINLVNDELLIAEAKIKGLDKTKSAKKEYKRILLQELLNEYSDAHISPTLNITENDLKELFAEFNTRIKVSHLYAPTKEKADSLYNDLLDGETFEELAKETFKDPQLQNNGGSLGYISVDETDPDFEKAAYSMKIGEISKPVKTVEGYSIIRVEDTITNPLLTQNEFLKAYNKLKGFARKRAYEDAVKKFAQSLHEKLNTKFNDAVISKLYNVLQNQPLLDFSETRSGFSLDDLKKTVVYSALGNWNLQTLIDEMSIVTNKQKRFIRTKANLEDMIAGLVNRKYIEQKAIDEGLNRTSTFAKNVQYNFNTYLLTTIETELKDQISIPPDSIKSYYEKNINQFRTEPTIRLSSILVNKPLLVDSIKKLLEAGNSFEELAKKYSIQSMTAENGGDMGFFKRNELDDLADEVFALNSGEWTGPFSNQGKYVLLKCTEKKEPVTKTFKESKEEIKETLINFEWYKKKDQYVESLKNKIICQLFPQKLYGLKF